MTIASLVFCFPVYDVSTNTASMGAPEAKSDAALGELRNFALFSVEGFIWSHVPTIEACRFPIMLSPLGFAVRAVCVKLKTA